MPTTPTTATPAAPSATPSGSNYLIRTNTHIHRCMDPQCKFLGVVKGTKNIYDLYACKGSAADMGWNPNSTTPGYVVVYSDRSSSAYMDEDKIRDVMSGKSPGYGSSGFGARLNRIFVKLYTGIHNIADPGAGARSAARPALKPGEICDRCRQVCKMRPLLNSYFMGCLC